MDGIEGITGTIRHEVAATAALSIRFAMSAMAVAALAAWSASSLAWSADKGREHPATVRFADRQAEELPTAPAPRDVNSQATDERDPAAQTRPDRLKPISEVTASLGDPSGDYPTDHAVPSLVNPRNWEYRVQAWDATSFCHRPLYFEDENLERYGRSFGLAQPLVSATHFTGRIAAWPYLAVAFPPRRCIYNLGREPAGSCAPYRIYRPPLGPCELISPRADDSCIECLDCDLP